jgi:mRNA deadenylase 3'-5' endonuclease subunit Ccr4
VLCYNILAESYASPERAMNCPLWALNWEYRKHRILAELLFYDPDILCLQVLTHTITQSHTITLSHTTHTLSRNCNTFMHFFRVDLLKACVCVFVCGCCCVFRKWRVNNIKRTLNLNCKHEDTEVFFDPNHEPVR